MIGAIGSGTSEDVLRRAGFEQLSVEALLGRILDHTVWGDFLYGYRFVSYFDSDGTIEGTNNVGSYNTGHWKANPAAGTFSVQWNQSWVPANLRTYEFGDTLHFFDLRTGLWHSSFDKIVRGKQPLEV